DLDDLAHELVAEDVALLHRGDVPVVEVEVGAADGGGGDPHHGVAWVHERRVGDVLDLDGVLAHPADGLHGRCSRGTDPATDGRSSPRSSARPEGCPSVVAIPPASRSCRSWYKWRVTTCLGSSPTRRSRSWPTRPAGGS